MLMNQGNQILASNNLRAEDPFSSGSISEMLSEIGENDELALKLVFNQKGAGFCLANIIERQKSNELKLSNAQIDQYISNLNSQNLVELTKYSIAKELEIPKSLKENIQSNCE